MREEGWYWVQVKGEPHGSPMLWDGVTWEDLTRIHSPENVDVLGPISKPGCVDDLESVEDYEFESRGVYLRFSLDVSELEPGNARLACALTELMRLP